VSTSEQSKILPFAPLITAFAFKKVLSDSESHSRFCFSQILVDIN